MSLEEALNRNSELLQEHNDLLRQVLGAAKAGGTATKDAGEKSAKASSKKAESKKSDESSDDAAGFDADALKAAIAKAGEWLGEFKDNEDDPETEARKTKLRAALDKLGYKLAKEINKTEDVTRFANWVEKQAAAGRITPEPSEDGDGGTDDDI